MNKPSVLIIDNDQRYSLSLSLRLENELTVITAFNGKDGLSAFDAKPVSLILLDLNLPDMSGLEVLKRIRERCVDVKVLIITSKSCHEWAVQCADLNVQGYREKPIDTEILVEKIRKMICLDDSNFLQILWGKEYEAKTISISHTIRQAMNYIHQNYHKNFSRDDVAAFAGISPDWLKEIIVFALNTGLRQGELIDLTWDRVDSLNKTFTILEQKNKGKDTLPLNENAMEVLNARSKVKSIKGYFVFYNKKGNTIVSSNLGRSFRSVVKKAGIAKFRFHDLRHTFATRLAQRGVDIYKIQRLGRWKSIQMVIRYAHHYAESLRDGIEKLDKIPNEFITILSQSHERRAAL